jgi:hypothetical protein
MVRKMDSISYHEYGTRAANACKQSAIDEIFSLPLIDAIGAAIALNDDAVMQAVIAWNGFDENLDRALQIIHSSAYVQAHFHLQDLMVIEREEAARISDLWLDEFPVYPNTVKDLHPSPIISMVEILNESSMPSHAPTAAATSRLQSVTI